MIGIFLGYSLLQGLEYLVAGVARFAIDFKGKSQIQCQSRKVCKFGVGKDLDGPQATDSGSESYGDAYFAYNESLDKMRLQIESMSNELREIKAWKNRTTINVT